MEITFDQFKAAVKEYLEVYCVEKGQVKNTTIKRKKDILKHLEVFLNGKPFNLENVRAFQHKQYANGLNETSSRATLANRIKTFISWCYKYADLFEKDWSYKIIKPTVHRKKWHLLSEENALKVIMAGCEPNSSDNRRIRESKKEHCLGMQFILLHGFRIGEVIAMRGSDVMISADIPYVRICRPKSQSEQWLPLHSHFLPILRERINNEKLFAITKKTSNKLLKKGAERLGLVGYDNSVHRLRDIYSLSRLRRHPLQVVSKTLRHDSSQTTDLHYSHYDLSDLVQVVEDSGVLQSPLTPAEFFEKAKKALKIAGLIRPEQYELKIYQERGTVKIEAVFPNKTL
jgi:integrase